MKCRQEARHLTPHLTPRPRPGLPCLRSAASVVQPLAACLLPLLSSLLLRPLCIGSILPRPGSPRRRWLRRGLSSICLCWNPGRMPSTASSGAQAVPAARGSVPLSVPLASGLGWLGHCWGREEGWGAQVGLTGRSQRNSKHSLWN